MTQCDAVLLIGFGGPTRAEEVRPFLDNILRGRPIPRERYEEVVHHYELMGGRSPYNEHTMRQAEALRARLRSDGIDCRSSSACATGNRISSIRCASWPTAHRARRVLGFILAAHRCEASWERYQARSMMRARDWARRRRRSNIPRRGMRIRSLSGRSRRASARRSRGSDHPSKIRAQLIFTAHSIPVAMEKASRLCRADSQSARHGREGAGTRHVDARLSEPQRHSSRSVAGARYQEAIRKLDGRPAVVMPIGFLCDHVEVLYDLDVEAAKIARECGVKMVRAATVGDHPRSST